MTDTEREWRDSLIAVFVGLGSTPENAAHAVDIIADMVDARLSEARYHDKLADDYERDNTPAAGAQSEEDAFFWRTWMSLLDGTRYWKYSNEVVAQDIHRRYCAREAARLRELVEEARRVELLLLDLRYVTHATKLGAALTKVDK